MSDVALLCALHFFLFPSSNFLVPLELVKLTSNIVLCKNNFLCANIKGATYIKWKLNKGFDLLSYNIRKQKRNKGK